MNTADQITKVLDELALRFGSTGAHLWAELVRYEIAGAVTALATVGFLWLILAVIAVWVWRHPTKETYMGTPFSYYASNTQQGPIEMTRETKWVEVRIAVVVATAVMLFVTTVVLPAVPALIAPEASVIRGLLP